MKQTANRQDILEAIRRHGLAGSVICLHSSLKSFGLLEGGPDTLIRAFVDSGCTLVVPTFTYECEVTPPADRIIPQNGRSKTDRYEEAIPFRQESGMISSDMGKIPARLLELDGHMRSDHPLNSFAAIGPLAREILAAQDLLDVYGPYERVDALPKAFVVLAGVGLTSTTPVHYAEKRAGHRMFHRWAKTADGSVVEVEVGSCSDGFDCLDLVVQAVGTTTQVGPSTWRIYPFHAFVETLARAIREDPSLTHCANPDCARCNDAVQGGPIL
jgi:aminoglycoside 3-N-acetyltransferase